MFLYETPVFLNLKKQLLHRHQTEHKPLMPTYPLTHRTDKDPVETLIHQQEKFTKEFTKGVQSESNGDRKERLTQIFKYEMKFLMFLVCHNKSEVSPTDRHQ